jgi:acetylornithine deacetylase
MSFDLVQTLADLVAIPSVNPMGRDLEGPEFLEHRVTAYLETLFDRWSLPWVRQRVEPLRENIIVRLDGDPTPEQGGKIVLLEAHQDTVPVDGMTISPWSPQVRDGRMYGRGACDIKGGLTAMLGAVSRLREIDAKSRPTVLLAATVNEEHGYSGALKLTELWREPNDFLPRPPDAAIVAEPTQLQVVVAHKGACRWRVRTHGKSVHSSQPQLGENAIYKMARVLQAFEAYQREVVPRLPSHHLCGRPSLSVGMIRGGLSVNTVPDFCSIEIDRRLIPGEESMPAYQEVIEFVARYPGVDGAADHETPYMQGSTLSDGPNLPLGERLAQVVRPLSSPCDLVGVPYGTNASKIAASGVPAVVFGPGSIDQAHTADEWLELAQLELASEALFRFVCAGG